MTPVSATTSSASRMRRGPAVLAAAGVLAAVAAGCGGDDNATGEATSAGTSVAAEVEQALYEKGDTQEVACETVGTVEVSGVPREVARCSFTEEKEAAGEMRARAGCFVLENGAPLDVTMDVPADVSCVKS